MLFVLDGAERANAGARIVARNGGSLSRRRAVPRRESHPLRGQRSGYSRKRGGSLLANLENCEESLLRNLDAPHPFLRIVEALGWEGDLGRITGEVEP